MPHRLRRARGGAGGRRRVHAVQLRLSARVLLPPRRGHLQLGRVRAGARRDLRRERGARAARGQAGPEARRRRRLRGRRPRRDDARGRGGRVDPAARPREDPRRHLPHRRQGGGPRGAAEDGARVDPAAPRGRGGRRDRVVSEGQGDAGDGPVAAPEDVRRHARLRGGGARGVRERGRPRGPDAARPAVQHAARREDGAGRAQVRRPLDEERARLRRLFVPHGRAPAAQAASRAQRHRRALGDADPLRRDDPPDARRRLPRVPRSGPARADDVRRRRHPRRGRARGDRAQLDPPARAVAGAARPCPADRAGRGRVGRARLRAARRKEARFRRGHLAPGARGGGAAPVAHVPEADAPRRRRGGAGHGVSRAGAARARRQGGPARGGARRAEAPPPAVRFRRGVSAHLRRGRDRVQPRRLLRARKDADAERRAVPGRRRLRREPAVLFRPEPARAGAPVDSRRRRADGGDGDAPHAEPQPRRHRGFRLPPPRRVREGEADALHQGRARGGRRRDRRRRQGADPRRFAERRLHVAGDGGDGPARGGAGGCHLQQIR